MAITLDGTNGITTPSLDADIIEGAALASQAEAETGTDNTKVMTPLRVAEAIAALGGNVTLTEFTSSGTYTKPVDASLIYVEVVGGGTSGEARSTSTTTTASGGASAAVQSAIYLASAVPSTVAVTVGAGGAARVATNNTNIKNFGSSSSFGPLLFAAGGGISPGQVVDTFPFSVKGLSGGNNGIGNLGCVSGQNASNNTTDTSAGNTSVLGFGSGGFKRSINGASNNLAAGDGGFPGGGGGGMCVRSGTATSGAGGNGVVRVFSF